MVGNINTPIVNAGIRYVSNLILSYQSPTTVTVGAGFARDNTNQSDIFIGTYLSPPVVGEGYKINAVNIGLNGIDAGALTANTNYYVFVIGDSTRNNAGGFVISLNPALPQIPIGYDMFRRIGCLRTDGTASFYRWNQFGRGEERRYYFDVGIPVLTNGIATTFTAVSTLGAVPPGTNGATEINFSYIYTPSSIANRAQLTTGNSLATNGIIVLGSGVAAAQQGTFTLPCNNNNIAYKVGTGDTLSLSVIGFIDYLSAPQ